MMEKLKIIKNDDIDIQLTKNKFIDRKLEKLLREKKLMHFRKNQSYIIFFFKDVWFIHLNFLNVNIINTYQAFDMHVIFP